jgi:hypothetical protein
MATALQNDDYIKYLIAIGFLDAGGGPKFPRVRSRSPPTRRDRDELPVRVAVHQSRRVGLGDGDAAGAGAGHRRDLLHVPRGGAQVLTVATATADTLITDNDATADSLQASRLGTQMNLFCDGTSWIASISGVPQSAFAQVGTVNT